MCWLLSLHRANAMHLLFNQSVRVKESIHKAQANFLKNLVGTMTNFILINFNYREQAPLLKTKALEDLKTWMFNKANRSL